MNDATDASGLNPALPPKRQPRPPMGTAKGAAASLGVLLLGLLFTAFLVPIAFLFFFLGSTPLMVIACIPSLAVPFMFGRLFGRDAWLLTLAYVLVIVFVAAPIALRGKYMGYVWTSGHDVGVGIALAFLYTGLSIGACFWGASYASRKKEAIRLRNPLLSIAPVVILCIAASIATPFAQNAVATGPSITFVNREYGYQFTVPGGWSEPFDNSVTISDEMKEKGAINLVYSDYEKFNYQSVEKGGINLRIYTCTAALGTPITAFNNPEECYSALTEEAQTNSYFESAKRLQVDSTPALALSYSDPDSRSTSVYILRAPYLYRIRIYSGFATSDQEHIPENLAAYAKSKKEILDSFKLRKPTAAPASPDQQ